jgi:hypothetical protein
MPDLAVTPDAQLNRAHWQILYDLEVVHPGWKHDAYQTTKDVTEQLQVFGVPIQVGVIDRWPLIVEILSADKEGWYLACLKDYTKVEIRVEDRSIVRGRDLKDVELDSKERRTWKPRNSRDFDFSAPEISLKCSKLESSLK